MTRYELIEAYSKTNPLLANALYAIVALASELDLYTMVHGRDEQDDNAMALANAVLEKAKQEMTR